jgi:hypothetical protein
LGFNYQSEQIFATPHQNASTSHDIIKEPPSFVPMSPAYVMKTLMETPNPSIPRSPMETQPVKKEEANYTKLQCTLVAFL